MTSIIDNNVVGTCREMCPKSEVTFREKEKLLHPLEVLEGTKHYKLPLADPNKMVKSYTRSAAGVNLLISEKLRPAETLLSTVNYLLSDVATNDSLPWCSIYDFINDRLKSVRQDMVLQNLPRAHSIAIMQPIVRFYSYSAYRLCEESVNTFDSHLNNTNLQECLKKILCWYDDCDILNNICEINGLSFADNLYAESRADIEAIYILFNLGESSAINRGLKLHKKWRRTKSITKSLIISINYKRNNWIKVCQIVKTLPTILLGIVALKLPDIRRNALAAMAIAFSSKNLTYPTQILSKQLIYSDNNDLISDCKSYGLICDNTDVKFSKTDFTTIKLLKPKHEEFVDKLLSKCDLSNLLLYGDEEIL